MSKNKNYEFKYSPRYSAKRDVFFCTNCGSTTHWDRYGLTCDNGLCRHTAMIETVDIETARNKRIAFLSRELANVMAIDVYIATIVEENARAEQDRIDALASRAVAVRHNWSARRYALVALAVLAFVVSCAAVIVH